jgi:threonylcarbamoyladenosine tRNA methylthiotransferase MtaB
MNIKFITLGCKVNQYETQELIEKFASVGITATNDVADIYVINTCSVTKRADNKSRDAIMRSKNENSQAKIVVCGCFAVDNRETIESLGVDCVIDQAKKHLLPEIVLSSLSGKELSPKSDIYSKGITRFSNHRAFVKIQDGCDNLCSFCKIPYLRGPSRSRSKSEIIKECAVLAKVHKEIVLCGVNISLYGRERRMHGQLKDLVADILKIPYLGRLRLSSLEPYYLDNVFFQLLRDMRFCPHFHFPFQYGDDNILKGMNKKETTALYEDKINRARFVYPDIAISCDIMVGFPGEDDYTFENTVNFLKRVKPMHMHVFTFSPREKTPLAKITIRNSKQIKKRYQILKELSNFLSGEYSRTFLGRTLQVVAEQYKDGFTTGFSQNYLKVYIEGRHLLGQLVSVRITNIHENKIYGELLD